VSGDIDVAVLMSIGPWPFRPDATLAILLAD